MADGGTGARCPSSSACSRSRARAARPSFDASITGRSAECHQPLEPATTEYRRMKEAPVEVEGVIHTVLPGTMFRVELDNKHLVLATISGKMRKRWVRLTVGDRVKMEMSPYDLDKARIVWRLK